MPYYRRVGQIPAKRHTQFRDAQGALYSEELMGQQGFSSDSSLLYHRHPPTALAAAVLIADGEVADVPATEPLAPHLLQPDQLERGGDTVTGRRRLLVNADVCVSIAHPDSASPLYRSADADEIIFVISGGARLDSVFGSLTAGSGDYVVIPRGVTHSWHPSGGGELSMLVIETRGHVGAPDRYRSPHGQFLETSPYCERDLHAPDAPLLVEGSDVDVVVRRGGQLTCFTYRHHPFDVVGWDGVLYPYRFAIGDFEPITGRIHQPPPVHQTFAAPGVVICSFVPRKVDYHPDSIPAPYNHANTDSDEVLVYVDGDFLSRRGVPLRQGSISYHPAGFIHGPQPGGVEASLGAERTEETAVMIDTFAPLQMTNAARSISDPDYLRSWFQ